MSEVASTSAIVEPPSYVPEEHLLRPRLGGAVVLLVVGLVGAAAYDGGDAIMLFWVLYALLPTVVAALLSLASWANRRHPQQVLLTILILALAVGPAIAVQRFAQSSGNALLLLVGAVVFVISVWLPQAAVALLYFQLRRPGGITLSPRFSLRTFMILVTVVAIVLAGARYYEQSSLEVALGGITCRSTLLETWPRYGPRRFQSDVETLSQRREASGLVANHLADYLIQRGYHPAPVPDELEAMRLEQARAYASPGQLVFNDAFHYFVRRLPGGDQVYLLMERRDGDMDCIQAGIWSLQPRGTRFATAVDPATFAERDQVMNHCHRVDEAAARCHDISQIKALLTKLTNQQPATP